MKKRLNRIFSGPKLIPLGFLFAIFIGAAALLLPFCWSGDGRLSPLDALFTSTSAVCVTGLIVADTARDFSAPGQIVILGLIQLGGLGVMTYSLLILLYLGGGASYRFQVAVKESLSRLSLSNVRQAVNRIVWITFAVEAVGALFLFACFMGDFPAPQALYHAVFHSISAFCNAGFSTFSDSLMGYRNDVAVNLTVSALIVLGGIGFTVLTEIIEFPRSRTFTLHAKLALAVTAGLIVVGTAGIFIFEWRNDPGSREIRSATDLLMTSFFHSVSARTAGFNTVDVGKMSAASLFLIMVLMLIGASPGGTGGGIKTTTFGALLASSWAIMKGKREARIFGRRLPDETLLRAFTIALNYVAAVAVFTMLMLSIKSFGLQSILFETISAMGTVGLSTGITSALTPGEKALIIFAMFIGRVGPLSLALALMDSRRIDRVRLAEGKILIG